jgi:YfiR/HmsC-like
MYCENAMKKLYSGFLLIGAVLLCLTIGPTQNVAAGETVSIDTRAKRLIGALNYLSKYSNSESPEFNLAIVYSKGVPKSVAEKAVKAFKKVAKGKIKGKQTNISIVEFIDETSFKSKLKMAKAHAIYVTAGNDGIIPKILVITRAQDILSMGATESHISKGITLGFDMVAGKAKIIINYGGSKNEAVEFSSQLLSVSDVRF